MAKIPEVAPLVTECDSATSDEDARLAHVGSRSRRRRLARAAGLSLLGACALSAAATFGRPNAAAAQDGGAVARGAAQDFVADRFGMRAGPALAPQDYIIGAIPRFDPISAHFGTPPMPPGPAESPSVIKMPGCPGLSCNKGHLCCASGDMCCGTSCCSAGSTCCNANMGLCCAPGTMCCWGEMCCAPGFDCGQTRDFSSGLRFEVLKQCGGGGQLRRLSEKVKQLEGPAEGGLTQALEV